MQTLILPGFSQKNKVWVDEVANSLKIDGLIRPFYWMHWTDEQQKFNPQEKADLIAKHIRGDRVNIIAKSVGTLVASLVYQQVSTQIDKMIFCGIPILDLKPNEIDIVKSVASDNKVVTFQNINDPHGSFESVKDFGNIRMMYRDDHEYPFFSEFQNYLK